MKIICLAIKKRMTCHLQQHGYLEVILLSEVSQKEKDTYCRASFLYGCQHTAQGNLSPKQTDSQMERADLWLPRARDVGEGTTGSLGSADVNYCIQDG